MSFGNIRITLRAVAAGDDRVFHPDQYTDKDQPVSAYWKTPLRFIERIFGDAADGKCRRFVGRWCSGCAGHSVS
jgi:hypothetical protein